MSWLNNSLNTIKGQLTTLAQEVLAETAGPGDDEYRGEPSSSSKSTVELLVETKRQYEDMTQLCDNKEREIAALRKQILTLQNQKISDSGGGDNAPTSSSSGKQTSNSSDAVDHNAAGAVLEDSWCWEPDNNTKNDNEPISSESSSSGNGNEMVNIRLEEVPLSLSSSSSTSRQKKRKQQVLEQRSDKNNNSALQLRLQQLEAENKQLNVALDDLDAQHILTMQNVFELKSDLQKNAKDQSIKCEQLQREKDEAIAAQETLQQRIENYDAELRRSVEETAELQALLEKRNMDNCELIERVKSTNLTFEKTDVERLELLQKVEQLTKELDEARKLKEKKTSESSTTSSTGKQSEDEFIVVRETDANSSGQTTPPTKEELRDKLLELENRVAELTLANGDLTLKLQDRELEKELSVNVLKEHLKMLEDKYALQTQQMNEDREKLNEFKERAAESIIVQKQIEALNAEKQKTLDNVSELEKRLIISEQEKEQLQLELQALRTEVQRKMQKLKMENQELKLSVEADTETTLNNSADLELKLKTLTDDNEALRAELDSLAAQAKFRQAIAEEKQEVTDLDAEDEEQHQLFNADKLRELLSIFIQPPTPENASERHEESLERSYRALRERINKIELLEKNLSHLSEEVVDLQDSKLLWDHEKKTLEADISQYILQCDELMKNNEILLNELENYKRNKLETIPENNEENVLQLETQLEDYVKLNRTLEQEYGVLIEKHNDLEREQSVLTEKLRETQAQNERLSAESSEWKLRLETLELERNNLQFELNEVKSMQEQNGLLKQTESKCGDLEAQLSRMSKDHADLVAAMQTQQATLLETNKKIEEQQLKLAQCAEQQQCKETQMEQLKQELLAKDIVVETLKNASKATEQRLNELIASGEQLTIATQQLESAKADLANKTLIIESLQRANVELTEAKETSHKQITELQTQYRSEARKQAEFNIAATQTIEPQSVTYPHEALSKIAQLEAQLLASADLRRTVDTLNYEKQEMIKALQQKHAENMQYYLEIQRLQTQVQQSIDNAESTITCQECQIHEKTIVDLRREHEKLQDQITFLKEKSDILTTNLLTEQTNQRLVQQAKADVEEQNNAIRKDLERLRQHLLEIEQINTEESVGMQRELDETKAKMLALQSEVSKSSNAYTSASIRANQHAETLQAQYALVVQQRDELVAKLSWCEDRESKSQAALCNLQCALEQFQNDKDNDIKAATQRIRRELQIELDKQTQLQNEVAILNQQLNDANQGLRAATRLSDQLESCQQTIAVLREEIDNLKQENAKLTQQLSTSESSQTDKIDKNLIKSLLIGYVVSGSPNDKQQVLRMISSVLDFTAHESDKVGLNKQQSSWLGTILGGGGVNVSGAQAGTHSKDNLVQAFVQFLEQESQPQTSTQKLPTLLTMTTTSEAILNDTHAHAHAGVSNQSSPSSRRTSVVGIAAAQAPTTSPSPSALTNISNVLGEFAPTRNSSSILKDILSDS